MTSLIDTHAHLTFPEFDRDRADVIKRAWDAGLEYIILVGAGNSIDGNIKAIELAQTDPRFFVTVGVHPHDAGKLPEGWLKKIEELAKEEKVVAIGEIGLDHHHKHSSKEDQKRVFKEQIVLANSLNKPIVIHDREAHADTLDIINEVGALQKGGAFHCFSGDAQFAKEVIGKGFLISIPGVVTFKNAKELHDVVGRTPVEKMMIETDCPFLAPEPYRGKRNEPAYVKEVARKIAEIKGLSPADVARVTTLAARRLFALPSEEGELKIAYQIRNSLYLNITNRCNLACSFCPKFTDFEVKGYYLKLSREPESQEILDAIDRPLAYDEIVFCGYGESTTRLEVLKEVAKVLKDKGVKKIRLNTDGLGNLTHGRNILPELKGKIDSISISLNAPDAAAYAKHCRSKYGEAAYEEVLKFILEAKKYIPEVVVSVVALPGLDIKACEVRAKELGVPLRVREYMNVG